MHKKGGNHLKSSRIMIAVLAMTGLLLTTGCTDSSAPSSVPLSSSASTNKTQTTTVPTQIPDESEESYVATITKKGVGSSRYGYQGSKRLDKLTDLGVSWYYNWGITIPDQTVNMEYVPMMWGANTATDSNFKKIQSGFEQGYYKNLLGFNEPDLPEQSNMTVEQAIALWPKLEQIGIRLGSPCPASSENYCSGWLKEFMDKCKERGYRVDFIAVHCYQDFSDPNAVNQLKTFLTRIYDTYKLPIWLTEFGTIDVSTWGGSANPNCTEEAAVKYTQASTEMLESLGFVERYAWFLDNFGGGANPPEAVYTRLYKDDDTMNSTGEIYRDVKSQFPLFVQTKTLPVYTAGEMYNQTVQVAGGTAPYTFSATGLPDGLTLDEKTGKISGVPDGKGGNSVKVTIKDQNGQTTFGRYTISPPREYK